MKNNKGITLTSLIIYLTVMFVVLATIVRVTMYFRDNISQVADVTFEEEFEKFNLYMLEETNKKGNNVTRVSEDGTEIEFKDGNIFTFVKENEDETGKIYLNNNIKICENVNECVFELEDNVLNVNITINETTKDVKYVINSVSILPDEYQEVEYIKSTGVQYIDTKKVITTNSEIECIYCKTASSGSTYATPFGSVNPNNGLYTRQLSPKNYTNFMNNSDIIYTSDLLADKKRKVNISINGVWEDGIQVVTYSKKTIQSGDSTTTLFARNNAGTIERYGSYRIYTFIWRENGTEVLNLIPCYRKTDEEIGFYDLINNKFYQNSGTGVFLKGDNVIYEDEKEENFIISENQYRIDKSTFDFNYKKIEYIESTGTQYIDIGVIGKTGIESYLDMEYTTVPNDASFLGSRLDNTRMYLVHSYPSKWCLGYGDYYSSSMAISVNTRYYIHSKLLHGEQTIEIDNNLIYSKTLESNYDTQLNLYLCGLNYNGTAKYLSNGKIYSLKIYEDGILTRNFIPCYRKSDQEVGLYDITNDVFYTNSGTGEFGAGPEVE